MTSSPKQLLPEYANPPLNEVVCGVLFKSLDLLLTPYLGVLWQHYKDNYPTCQEVPPIIPIIESFERQPKPKPELTEIPPLPRVWFVHADGNGVIQVRRDRFLHNWRQLKRIEQYPRFEPVFDMFVNHFETFKEFVKKHNLGTLEPLQYELTYINHIYQGEGWSTNADVGKIFSDFVWRAKEGRFLPEPEIINWRTTFVLPNAETFGLEEVDLSIRRGVFPLKASRRLLFSQTLELPTGKLRRLTPRVSLDRRSLENQQDA